MDTTSSMTSSSTVIGAHQVRLTRSAVRIPVLDGPHSQEPTVTEIRDGDVVVGVEIACSCGQRIRLNFDY